MKKTKLGVIGCGMISGAYLKAASRFQNIEIVAGSDIVPGRAAAKRDEFKEFGYNENTFRAYDANPEGTNEELLADPEIEVVLNLTPAETAFARGSRNPERGQARLFREAVRRESRGCEESPETRRREESALRMRT